MKLSPNINSQAMTGIINTASVFIPKIDRSVRKNNADTNVAIKNILINEKLYFTAPDAPGYALTSPLSTGTNTFQLETKRNILT